MVNVLPWFCLKLLSFDFPNDIVVTETKQWLLIEIITLLVFAFWIWVKVLSDHGELGWQWGWEDKCEIGRQGQREENNEEADNVGVGRRLSQIDYYKTNYLEISGDVVIKFWISFWPPVTENPSLPVPSSDVKDPSFRVAVDCISLRPSDVTELSSIPPVTLVLPPTIEAWA